MESRVVFFDNRKPENTDTTFRLVKERLSGSKRIKKLVIASTTGATALKALEFFQDTGVKLVVVSHQFDFRRKVHPFPPELARKLRDAGHEVYYGTMLFHTDSLYENKAPTLMANLLRCFSQGVKVCFEIVLMVTDAGLVASGEKVIAIAGTVRGADTAMVMQAASTQHLKHLRVQEILCKPLNPLNIEEVYEQEAGTE